MTRICPRCSVEKDIEQFNWKIKDKQRQSHCKICQSELTKRHYKNNKQPYLDRAKTQNEAYRREQMAAVHEYFKTHPCVDCGETDPLVLEFDHIKDKSKNISQMIGSGRDCKKLFEEIAKCEVRCANCHRRKTAKQFGYYSYLQ